MSVASRPSVVKPHGSLREDSLTAVPPHNPLAFDKHSSSVRESQRPPIHTQVE